MGAESALALFQLFRVIPEGGNKGGLFLENHSTKVNFITCTCLKLTSWSNWEKVQSESHSGKAFQKDTSQRH